jgi:hypothetical protein
VLLGPILHRLGARLELLTTHSRLKVSLLWGFVALCSNRVEMRGQRCIAPMFCGETSLKQISDATFCFIRLSMKLQPQFDEAYLRTIQHEVIPWPVCIQLAANRPRKRPYPPSNSTMTQVVGAFKITPTPTLSQRSARLPSKTAANLANIPRNSAALDQCQTPKIRAGR